jgi:hypothetical protein
MTSSDDDISIAVNNRGTFIPPDKLSNIFDPMVRIAASVNTDYTERTSLGIGLFISREIVNAHGGADQRRVECDRWHDFYGDDTAQVKRIPIRLISQQARKFAIRGAGAPVPAATI